AGGRRGRDRVQRVPARARSRGERRDRRGGVPGGDPGRPASDQHSAGREALAVLLVGGRLRPPGDRRGGRGAGAVQPVLPARHRPGRPADRADAGAVDLRRAPAAPALGGGVVRTRRLRPGGDGRRAHRGGRGEGGDGGGGRDPGRLGAVAPRAGPSAHAGGRPGHLAGSARLAFAAPRQRHHGPRPLPRPRGLRARELHADAAARPASGPRVPGGTMSTMTEPRTYGTDTLLRDGTSLHLRSIRPEDKDRLADHFSRLGPESIRQRFFGVKKELTPEGLPHFTEPDVERHVGRVSTHTGARGEEFVVVGRYFRLDPTPEGVQRAEFALAVADAWQGRGAGTVMLEHLAGLAGQAGIERFEADVLADNIHMRSVIAHLGFEVGEQTRQGVVRAWFPVRLTEAARAASDARAFAAAAESVRGLLHPRSVALVGASRRPGTIGHALLANLRRQGFAGPIYPVNPEI